MEIIIVVFIILLVSLAYCLCPRNIQLIHQHPCWRYNVETGWSWNNKHSNLNATSNLNTRFEFCMKCPEGTLQKTYNRRYQSISKETDCNRKHVSNEKNSTYYCIRSNNNIHSYNGICRWIVDEKSIINKCVCVCEAVYGNTTFVGNGDAKNETNTKLKLTGGGKIMIKMCQLAWMSLNLIPVLCLSKKQKHNRLTNEEQENLLNYKKKDDIENNDRIPNFVGNIKNLYALFHIKLEHCAVVCTSYRPAIADMMIARFSNTNPPSTKEVMAYEMLRVCTFHDYPENGVSTIKLAKSGFYFAGTEDEVECFNCNLKIKNWNSRMIPKMEHKNLSTECDMALTEGKNCGNVSMYPTENNGHLQVPARDSGYGSSGNNTGQSTQNSNTDRPNNIATSSGSNHENEESRSQNNLVADGSSRSSYNGYQSMVSNQNSTTTRDASNSSASPLNSYSQASSDHSTTNHDSAANRFSSPSQEGATNGVSNPSQDRGATNQDTNVYQPTISTNETNYTSMQTTEQPSVGKFNSGNQGKTNAKYPQLVLKQDRVQTFVDKGWSTPTTGMEPEVLAEAGLFYGGKKDIVRCFHCGIGLQNWQRGDRPEVEHARWSPKCPYIIQNQGINFVNAVMDAVAQKAHRESQQNTVADTGNANQQQPPAATNTPQRPIETDHVRQHVPGQAPPQALHAAPTRQTNSVRNKKKEQAASNEKKTEKKEMAGITTDKELTEYVKDLSIKRKGGLKGGTKSLFVNDPQYKKLLEDNRNLRDRAVCKVCLEDEICMVFMPCGHMVTCENCGKVIKRCAVCRKQITEKIMTHTIDEEKDMVAVS